MAVYPLNDDSGTNETSHDVLPSRKASNVSLKGGLRRNPIGSHFLNGSSDRCYIFISKGGDIDVRYSITITAWVFPVSGAGPIFSYKSGLGISASDRDYLEAHLSFREYDSQRIKLSGLQNGTWNFVGFSYDFISGLAELWIGNTSVLRSVGNQKQISTESDFYVGSSSQDLDRHFRGRMSDLKIYDIALNNKQRQEERIFDSGK